MEIGLPRRRGPSPVRAAPLLGPLPAKSPVHSQRILQFLLRAATSLVQTANPPGPLPRQLPVPVTADSLAPELPLCRALCACLAINSGPLADQYQMPEKHSPSLSHSAVWRARSVPVLVQAQPRYAHAQHSVENRCLLPYTFSAATKRPKVLNCQQ